MEHRKSPWINFSFFAVDCLMILLAAWLSFWLRKSIPWGGPANLPVEHYHLFLILFVPVLLLTMLFSGQYRYNRGVSILLEFMSIVRLVFLAVVAMLALAFFYRDYQFSRLHILYFFVTAVVTIFFGRVVLRLWLRRVRASGRNQMHLVVVGDGERLDCFVNELNQLPGFGYSVDGIFSFSRQAGSRVFSSQALNAWLESHRVDEAYLLMGSGPSYERKLKQALEIFEFEGIRMRLIPDYENSFTTGAKLSLLGNIPVFAVSEYPLDFWYNRALKRGFDLLVALTGLILTAPLLLLVYLAIRFSSKGPVLFKQERLGLDRKPFMLFKFRTMRQQEQSESDTTWTVKDDPRVTPLGRFLRKTSLDELPQLINILKGEMSLVGPRPEREHFVKVFKEKIPLYMERHRVKAGLTGWAQVSGYRGDSSIKRRIQADHYYIRNWTLAFDLRIVLLTIIRVLLGRNAH